MYIIMHKAFQTKVRVYVGARKNACTQPPFTHDLHSVEETVVATHMYVHRKNGTTRLVPTADRNVDPASPPELQRLGWLSASECYP